MDGYRASRIVVSLREHTEAEFVAFIRPFSFKVSSGGNETVLLGLDEENAFVEFKSAYGITRYTFDKPTKWSVDIANIFQGAKVHDREIGVNAKYLSDACKAIASTIEDRNNLSVLESSDNPMKAFCIRGKGNGFTTDQLILPVRFIERRD